ncbi:fungal-specific transcription factor domain-containing protein [Xylaria grammica]|nr:fungal-specific transcription factor domain-containing protein [Xylaria grammica]
MSDIEHQQPSRQHKRVGRACDFCKRKKIRCNGKQPCFRCIQDHITCEYRAPYARGKRRASVRRNLTIGTEPTVSINSPISQSSYSTVPSQPRESAWQGSTSPQNLQPANPHPEAKGRSLRASPEPGERDRQGHFVGASSGLTFLLRLQRRLRRDPDTAPKTSVFTLGDAVLPTFDETSFAIPPRQEAESILKTYFELASPTYRYLHRPTVAGWMRELYADGNIAGGNFYSKYAVVLTMLAQGISYVGSNPNGPDAETGVRCFLAAQQAISRETGPASLSTVQALLGACFCLLTRSRLAHCWSLFGTTARLILALGLHRRKKKPEVGLYPPTGFIELECGKRTFWAAYTLDRYLSAILGRPCAFHDDDIDQEPPAIVEDQNLNSDSIIADDKRNMNTMLAPFSHRMLSLILGETLRRLYGVKSLDKATQYATMSELGTKVDAWKRDLPAFLNADKVDSKLLVPLFQRQSNILGLASAHVRILIYRPCLFNDYDKSLGTLSQATEDNVAKCVNAAMDIVTVVDRMIESAQFYAASWFSHYQAFCAVVVLYTYTIRCKLDRTIWGKYYHAAERCQGCVATVANVDSLAQRLWVIMEEFRLEVLSQLQYEPPNSHDIATQLSNDVQESQLPLIQEPSNPEHVGPSSNAGFLDLPSWELLDSLALDLGIGLPDEPVVYSNASLGL